MNILVTGGAGYIGSHTVVELIKVGHNVILVDSLSNSDIEVLDKIEIITSMHNYAIHKINIIGSSSSYITSMFFCI